MDKIDENIETDWTQAAAIAPAEIPTLIREYLEAHEARDVDRAMAMYAADAVVRDEDHDYRGVDEIRAWLSKAGAAYTYTSTFLGASRLDASRFDVEHRLEGDFPGGVADLHFRFTLADGRVARLVIEP